MNYSETLEYLYAKLPVFQKIGAEAINPKLTNIIALCEHLDNPQRKLKCIHVGGTNGKGSSSHFITSILIEAGLKVGLYTSPHLKDFRERFKIDGREVSQEYIVAFVNRYKTLIETIKPSFFELTVALAFKLFEDEKVDIAVIEVGLGGRHDSTNIIEPIASLITNIGLDHTDILGNSLKEIAYEKAGIIKNNTPVVISEFSEETAEIFKNEALITKSNIIFAKDHFLNIKNELVNEYRVLDILDVDSDKIIKIQSSLSGDYQIANILGVLTLFEKVISGFFSISLANIKDGIKNVIVNTNLKGRWQILNKKPLTICDTGHNDHAFNITSKRIESIEAKNKHLLLGFVSDKDVEKILSLFTKDYIYYFCEFNSFRSLKINDLKALSEKFKLNATFYNDVNMALASINKIADENDFIFIGGSTYLVGELNNL